MTGQLLALHSKFQLYHILKLHICAIPFISSHSVQPGVASELIQDLSNLGMPIIIPAPISTHGYRYYQHDGYQLDVAHSVMTTLPLGRIIK